MTDNQHSQKNNKKRSGVQISPWSFFIYILFSFSLILYFAWQAGYLGFFFPASEIPTTTPTPTIPAETPPPPMATDSLNPITETATKVPAAILPSSGDFELPGLIVFSMTEAGYSHLFGFQPETLPITRLTVGDWDDRQPAISPDGTKIAFTSNRSGHWDLYQLDLLTGETTQFTEDLAYDGHPAWSSDGLWLAYEKMVDNNLEIFIKPTLADIQETRITFDFAQDYEPAWQPGTTSLAFTSTRTGKQDVFLVNTSQDLEAINFTKNPTIDQSHPGWSADGEMLYWVSSVEGYPTLFGADIRLDASKAHPVLNANFFAGEPTGQFMVSVQSTPDQFFLSVLENGTQTYRLLPTLLPGQVDDIAWGPNTLPLPLPASILQASQTDPQTPWREKLLPGTGALYGRQNIIDLPGIKAPHAALSALAVEPFYALKDRSNASLGWDVLSDLENMFVSIAQPLPPGRSNDWLYTGRAFSLNPILIDFEYMAVVREEFGPKTYWRVFLKPLDQSGSQGSPLTQFPWDFNARYSGSPSAYEAGGEPMSAIPSGYWVDFSSLSFEYGWERQPALSNWESYYQGARFNVFVISSGLTWEDAMLQIWPPEVFQNQESP